MKMIIEYAGKSYESAESDEETKEQVMKAMYADMENLTKIQMELKGGGFLILGSDAIQSCAIIIV